jgi:hypothetical protein
MNKGFSDNQRLLLVSVGVSLSLICAISLLVTLVPNISSEWLRRGWIRFSILATAQFLYSMKVYWPLRKIGLFWCLLSLVTAFHVLVVGHFWKNYGGLSYLSLFAIQLAEWLALALAVYLVFGITPNLRQNTGGRWLPRM